MFVQKKTGETTSELSERIKKENNFTKLAICGKLDPMARGLTRILADKNTKFMSKNLNHNKTYNFNIVLNIKTDTDDILGLIKNVKDQFSSINLVYKFLESLKYEKMQHFHPVSAIKIKKNGVRKSLHQWSLSGSLTTDMIPKKKVTVYSVNYQNYTKINTDSYIKLVKSKLSTISKNNINTFRVPSIMEDWNNFQVKYPNIKELYVIPVTMQVSSGYYIRMISYYLSSRLNILSHIYDIERIQC